MGALLSHPSIFETFFSTLLLTRSLKIVFDSLNPEKKRYPDLEMPQGQPLPCPLVDENVSFLPVPHIMAQHLAGITGQFHGLGHVAPGPAIVLALSPREGALPGVAVPQFDPGC
jgi:hypothetical protein